MHNILLTTAEAARVLQVSPSAVSRMVTREELVPAFKAPGVRGSMFFDPAVVEKLAARRAAESDPAPDEAAEGGAA